MDQSTAQKPVLAPITGALMGFALRPANAACHNGWRLLASGAPRDAFGFLFAAPVLNQIVLASTWAAFPDQQQLLMARPLGAFLLAVLLGVLLVAQGTELSKALCWRSAG